MKGKGEVAFIDCVQFTRCFIYIGEKGKLRQQQHFSGKKRLNLCLAVLCN